MKRFFALLPAVLLIAGCASPAPEYSWEEDLAYRERCEFTWTREQVKEYIQQYIPDVTDEQIDRWTANGPLESKIIDGELKYFKRTASGLFRVDPDCRAAKAASEKPAESETLTGNIVSSDQNRELEMMRAVIAHSNETGTPYGEPVRMKVKFTLTVDADAVPSGEKIRCWLPFPRQDVGRQTDVKLLYASEKRYKLSGDECPHSTLYMEKKAVEGEPTVFSEEFEYTSSGECHQIDETMVKPYDTSSELYKVNTAERETHIIFSDRMRALADELTSGIDNPYLQTKAIFSWIRAQYPWAGARDYSTLENIPEYVLDAGHGDCGQVTLLLMTLLRIKGIPCHWQSGLLTDPSGWNMHDWCEVYFEGIGWIPVDQSAGVKAYAPDEQTRYFYIGGCSPYRLVVNQDYSCELSPRKRFPRSDTVDFQRGEVEWRGGNIYYDKWHCTMEIEYL